MLGSTRSVTPEPNQIRHKFEATRHHMPPNMM